MEDINNNKQSSSQESPDLEKCSSNNVNEPEIIYETQQTTDLVFTQEIIDQANEAIRRLDSGESKGFTVEEALARTKAMFKERFNIEYDDYRE